METNRLFYPAVFHPEGDGFWVSFPDFPECLTEGDDMEHARRMAVEALELTLLCRKKDKEEIPAPTPLGSIQEEDGILVLIECNMEGFAKEDCQEEA